MGNLLRVTLLFNTHCCSFRRHVFRFFVGKYFVLASSVHLALGIVCPVARSEFSHATRFSQVFLQIFFASTWVELAAHAQRHWALMGYVWRVRVCLALCCEFRRDLLINRLEAVPSSFLEPFGQLFLCIIWSFLLWLDDRVRLVFESAFTSRSRPSFFRENLLRNLSATVHFSRRTSSAQCSARYRPQRSIFCIHFSECS